MRSFAIKLIAPLLLAWTAHAQAQFEGELVLLPPGCESVGQCTLKHRFRFVDSAKEIWEARAGLPTDGASIPGLFQPFVGEPFDPAFIRAAVIHDHYCARTVKSWRTTHRVFYEGLRAGGVPAWKAKSMYFAVILGGPKWIKLMPGKYCGQGCVNSHKSVGGTPGIFARRADYSAPGVNAAVQEVSKALEANPDAFSLEDLETEARKRRPADFFYNNGSEIEASKMGITQ